MHLPPVWIFFPKMKRIEYVSWKLNAIHNPQKKKERNSQDRTEISTRLWREIEVESRVYLLLRHSHQPIYMFHCLNISKSKWTYSMLQHWKKLTTWILRQLHLKLSVHICACNHFMFKCNRTSDPLLEDMNSALNTKWSMVI